VFHFLSEMVQSLQILFHFSNIGYSSVVEYLPHHPKVKDSSASDTIRESKNCVKCFFKIKIPIILKSNYFKIKKAFPLKLIGATTLSIKTHSVTTFSIVPLSISKSTTLSILTLSISALVTVMLSVVYA
jgi:hypothetical protein